jgi:hypothetical protein
MAEHKCVRVPLLSHEDRKEYGKCANREEWVRHCLGKDGVYVGRPKNDGGWYRSPTVKAGSMFANPFSLKAYDLEDSLKQYRAYIEARLCDSATTLAVIDLLPTEAKNLAHRRFASGIEKLSVGKSVAHLRLDVVADKFRACLLDLKEKKLGCFCEEADPCHAKVLAEIVQREVMCKPCKRAAEDGEESQKSKRPRR